MRRHLIEMGSHLYRAGFADPMCDGWTNPCLRGLSKRCGRSGAARRSTWANSIADARTYYWNSMSLTHRIWQFVLVASVLVVSWLGMQAAHEAGHVLMAWASGETVHRVVLHPLTISRADAT